MGAEENKALIRQWIEEGMTTVVRDPSRIDELVEQMYHDHMTTNTPYHHHHTETGLEGLKNELRNTAASFGDVEAFVVDEIIAEGDLVAAHWTLKEGQTTGEGVHRHVGQVDTGGRTLEVSGLILYRLLDGKILEYWHYTNAIDVLLQHQIIKIEPVSQSA